jgi:hypothetical protein
MKDQSTEAVAASWGLTIGGLTLAQVHQIAGLFVMIVSFCYTLWRWNKDIKQGK